MSRYLQSYVVPVCTFTPEGDKARIGQCFGSAFLINSSGWCLTAAHVLLAAVNEGEKQRQLVGVIGKSDKGESSQNMFFPLSLHECAPSPFDVAIFKTTYLSDTLFSAMDRSVEHWQEVATLGYPLNAIGKELEKVKINLRAQRGHIQRLIAPNELPFEENPPAFELSFLISRGMSGSPIFIHSQPRDIVVGVCVSSFRSETIDDEFIEVRDDGSKYVERKMKIEEFGIAHDLRPLLDWKPGVLSGESLGDVFL